MAIAWTPKYSKNINKQVDPKLFWYFINDLANKLEWDYNSYEEDKAIFIRQKHNRDYERIIIKNIYGKEIRVESISIQSNIMDFGSNKKNVQKIEELIKSMLTDEDIERYRKQKIKDDEEIKNYKGPERLETFPEILTISENKLFIKCFLLLPILGIVHSASTYFIFFIGLAGILLGFISAFLINKQMNNTTIIQNFSTRFISLSILITTAIFSLLTTYTINKIRYHIDIDFISFVIEYFKAGIKFKDINLKIYGKIAIFGFDFLIAYWILVSRLSMKMINKIASVIPEEVVIHIYKLLSKGLTIDEIKADLKSKGLSENNCEYAIEGIAGADAIRRER